MRTSPQFLFVLTDGGRARFVRKSATSGHFETFDEIEGLQSLETAREKVRSRTLPRTQSSFSPRRSSISRESPLRLAKEAFLDQVADRAADTCRREQFSGVFIAAPPRLIGQLEARLRERGSLAGTLGKDLTKVPVERLGRWLDDVTATRVSER